MIYFPTIHKRTLTLQHHIIIAKLICSKSAQQRKRPVVLTLKGQVPAHYQNRTQTKHSYETTGVIWTSNNNPVLAVCPLGCLRMTNKTIETTINTTCSETPPSKNWHHKETSQSTCQTIQKLVFTQNKAPLKGISEQTAITILTAFYEILYWLVKMSKHPITNDLWI